MSSNDLTDQPRGGSNASNGVVSQCADYHYLIAAEKWNLETTYTSVRENSIDKKLRAEAIPARHHIVQE